LKRHQERVTLSGDVVEQIPPIRVGRLDQVQLPVALPFLHAKLAKASLLKIVMRFVPDKETAAMLGAELAAKAVPMLSCASHEIAGDAQVKRSITATCHDVDVTGLPMPNTVTCSCEGRNPVPPSPHHHNL